MNKKFLQSRGKIDSNDLDHLERLYKKKLIPQSPIVRAEPAPISVFKGQEKINPHLTRFYHEDGQITDVFHVKPIYYLHHNKQWRPMDEIANGFGNRWINLKENWADLMDSRYLRWLLKRMELIDGEIRLPSEIPIRIGQEIHFTSSTFFPDPDPESTSVDGSADRTQTEAWTNSVNGAGEGSSGTVAQQPVSAFIRVDTQNQISRWIALFDSSAIPDTDVISAAVESVKPQAVVTTNNGNVGLIATTPGSNTAIVNSDYENGFDLTSPTEYATRININSFTAESYTDFTLTNLTIVSATGVSKTGFRMSADIDDSAPGGGATADDLVLYSADSAGTTKDPKLVVTHAAASTFTPKIIMF